MKKKSLIICAVVFIGLFLVAIKVIGTDRPSPTGSGTETTVAYTPIEPIPLTLTIDWAENNVLQPKQYIYVIIRTRAFGTLAVGTKVLLKYRVPSDKTMNLSTKVRGVLK